MITRCQTGAFFLRSYGSALRGRERGAPEMRESRISRPYDPSSPNGGRPASHLSAYRFGGRALPFFDLLTPKEGRRVTRLFRPAKGVRSRQRLQFRLDRTLASRVHETARRTHSNKWQVGFFQKHPRGPTLDTVAPGAPPSEPPKAREKSGASCTKSLPNRKATKMRTSDLKQWPQHPKG